MNPLSNLKIPKSHIALFASGNSVHQIDETTFANIKTNTFVITLNYAPIHLKGHLNIWSDRKVSDFLENHYQQQSKDCLLAAQQGRVNKTFKGKIDYWFNRTTENIKGNYTLVWALQLLQKYFPNKTILLFGVDMYATDKKQAKWYDNYTDFDLKKRGTNYKVTEKLNQCAAQIQKYVSTKGVYNCNLESRLDYFEKKDWPTILKLKILHLCPSALAGAPVHLSNIINKYTLCESKTILKKQFTSKDLNKLRWQYDVVNPTKRQLAEAIDWADFIHYHRNIYSADTKNKPSVLQYHSPPNAYQANKTHAAWNGRKMVIAQYHPRFYTDAYIVPNLIDIWDDNFQSNRGPNTPITIFYSWASEIKGGWSDKGSTITTKILQKIKAKYGEKVNIQIFHNRPYTACMAAKRLAHICIDECVTGSYHLQSLEGCAVGAVTFNNIDNTTLGFIEQVNRSKTHPFVKTNLNGLYKKLCYYIENETARKEKGSASRTWMETYWNPKVLVHRYTNAYFNIMNEGKIVPISPSKPNVKPRISIIQQKETPKIVPPISKPTIVKVQKPTISKSIEILYQKYKDEDIYIFGTGPSLFKVKPEDFKNKICLSINYAFEVMPYMNYYMVHVIEAYESIRYLVDNNKLILSETLVREWQPSNKKPILPNRIPVFNEEAYVYPLQNPNEKNINNKHVVLSPQSKIFTWSTTTHSAIHIAAYMGAKNIYLVGVDYQLFPKRKVHFKSKHNAQYGQQKWHALAKHEQGDKWLQKQLKEQGIHLSSYQKKQTKPIVNKAKPTQIPTTPTTTHSKKIAKSAIKKSIEQFHTSNTDLLSICITNYNKSKVPLQNGQFLNLLPHCLKSIAASVKNTDNVEVIISDFESTDWPLKEWIGNVLKDIPYRVIQVKEHFHRGKGRNIAANHAHGNYLFFLDADMIISKRVLENGLRYMKKGVAYFPMCLYFLNLEHTKGFWCQGKGNVLISKKEFNKAGKWPAPPEYTEKKNEDLLFYNKVKNIGVKSIIEKEEKFYHQYHPGWSVDIVFQNYKHLIIDTSNINKSVTKRNSTNENNRSYQLPSKKINVRVNNKEFTVLDHFFFRHHRILKWELYTYNIFKHYLREKYVYIDIGTWIGPTILYAFEVGVKSIFGVEANPNTHKMVVENCSLNNIPATIQNLCILDKKGKTKFGNKNKNNPISDLSSISSIQGNSWDIDTISLCQYINQFCPLDWNFIKIDIEGAEAFIIEDLVKLSKRQNTVIYLSLHPPFWKDKEQVSNNLIEATKAYRLLDIELNVLSPTMLKKMTLTNLKQPAWGTKYGNFFEIILESR